jgi:phosphotransferase system IIB component
MKIRAVGGELFIEDGRTDMTKLIVAFRNFSNAPKTRLSIFLM